MGDRGEGGGVTPIALCLGATPSDTHAGYYGKGVTWFSAAESLACFWRDGVLFWCPLATDRT